MTTRPVIFISAVSKELKTARDLVAKTLLTLGYEPKWQDIAPTEAGELRSVLRKWVDESEAVIQLVGKCYGFGPLQPNPHFGLCSYTQYEALYAESRGKKVWYLPAGPSFPCDTHAKESEEFQQLQAAYLQRIRDQNDLRHAFADATQLENIVLKMRDDLAPLRAEWEIHRQKVESGLAKTEFNTDLILQKLESMVKGGSEAKLIADYDTALAIIAAQEHITVENLCIYLADRAERIVGDPHSSLQEKVKSLRNAGRFIEARDFAVEAAARLENVRQRVTRDEIEMLIEVTTSEINLGHYDQALAYAINAESLADRETDFLTWSAARIQLGCALGYMRRDFESLSVFQELVPLLVSVLGAENPNTFSSRSNLALALHSQGKDAEAEAEYKAVLALWERVNGTEHPGTLSSRNNLALSLVSQGKYAEAEAEHRAVLVVWTRVQGAEHPDTLTSRMNLANALVSQGKYAEAEAEHRAVLVIRERVQGAEHPDTLSSRNNLALTLVFQGKCAEAEQRAVLAVQERVQGAEHPNTLNSRMNLASALDSQGKCAESEAEHRAVLVIRERVQGAEHLDTLSSRHNLALALYSQGKYAEAETENRAVLVIRERVQGAEHPGTLTSLFNLALNQEDQGQLLEALALMQRAEAGWTKVLGLDHPNSQKAQRGLNRIHGKIRKTRGKKAWGIVRRFLALPPGGDEGAGGGH